MRLIDNNVLRAQRTHNKYDDNNSLGGEHRRYISVPQVITITMSMRLVNPVGEQPQSKPYTWVSTPPLFLLLPLNYTLSEAVKGVMTMR